MLCTSCDNVMMVWVCVCCDDVYFGQLVSCLSLLVHVPCEWKYIDCCEWVILSCVIIFNLCNIIHKILSVYAQGELSWCLEAHSDLHVHLSDVLINFLLPFVVVNKKILVECHLLCSARKWHITRVETWPETIWLCLPYTLSQALNSGRAHKQL